MVLALTTVPGILESFLIIQLKTIFPMSRLTRKLHKAEKWFLRVSHNHRIIHFIHSVPDGHDVGEQEKEPEDLEVPTARKVLESDHDQRHHHQGPEQDLSQTVHLQVEQTNLTGPKEANFLTLIPQGTKYQQA